MFKVLNWVRHPFTTLGKNVEHEKPTASTGKRARADTLDSMTDLDARKKSRVELKPAAEPEIDIDQPLRVYLVSKDLSYTLCLLDNDALGLWLAASDEERKEGAVKTDDPEEEQKPTLLRNTKLFALEVPEGGSDGGEESIDSIHNERLSEVLPKGVWKSATLLPGAAHAKSQIGSLRLHQAYASELDGLHVYRDKPAFGEWHLEHDGLAMKTADQEISKGLEALWQCFNVIEGAHFSFS